MEESNMKMSRQKILALMYDFYNENTLKGQNDDIPYYIEQIKKYNAKKILVVGAGTGRVAIPLANYAEVTALDFDSSRLEILLERNPQIKTINANFLEFETSEHYDLIIIPYSTLQFANDTSNPNRFLEHLRKAMDTDSLAIFDVSESFNTKPNCDRKLLFTNYCETVDDDVSVYYSSKRYDEYIAFVIEYQLQKYKKTFLEKEKYYYYDPNLLTKLIDENALELIKIDNGYGKPDFNHKHLYHCRRKL